MPIKDPFTYKRERHKFPTMKAALKAADNKPHLGVTQGGSSRENSGARVAATNGLVRSHKRRSRDG